MMTIITHHNMKKQNLLGKKFGRLTVISEAKPIKEGKILKTTWNCVCECGNIILAKSYNLNRGGVLSCGCFRDSLRIKIKSNQKFGRLTTLSYNGESVWQCKCECGELCLVKSDKLSLGKTKSCGCLAKEISKKNIQHAIKFRRKYEPHITSARRIWQNYCRMDKTNSSNPIISFEKFFKLSQQVCHYCGAMPNNKYNIFSYSYYKGSDLSINNGNFIYNGLDKINNAEKHTDSNCVPCCIICNRAKSNRSYEDMLSYIANLSYIDNFNINFNILDIPKSIYNKVKIIWKQNYNDSDIDINEFYSLSQIRCFYCGLEKSNKYNNYYYNGLDRINSNLLHTKNNVVPCCKHCNFAKSNLSLEEFNNWINKVKSYQSLLLSESLGDK